MKVKQVGTDPEVFVSDDSGIVPGVGLIGGTKIKPLPVANGAIQEDNVLAEFNIVPASTEDEFVSNIRSVMEQLAYRVAPMQLRVLSSHRFDKEVLKKAGPQAMEFGCEPDFNAWTTNINPRPNADSNLRTAGGHVHVSFDDEGDEYTAYKVGAMMDFFLGVPSVLLDSDNERRRMYGAAGSIRPKEYGVEYRTLSNFWLNSEKLMRWVYQNTVAAVENVESIMSMREQVDSLTVQSVINTGNVNEARRIVDQFHIPMPA
jgi:hypothetical protein